MAVGVEVEVEEGAVAALLGQDQLTIIITWQHMDTLTHMEAQALQ